MSWNKTDNSMENEKALMREKYLPENASVLDLFCGSGEMYKRAYRGNVCDYHGTDISKVHNLEICEITNNEKYVRRNDLDKYNTFDLDAYGSPWKLFYLILKMKKP